MPSFLELPYHQVCFKSAHNAYDRDEFLVEQLEWNANHPPDAGCMGAELDIVESRTHNRWAVSHNASRYERNHRQLSQFLSELRVWSRQHPKHLPVTLELEVKVKVTNYADKLDAYLRDHLDVRDGGTQVYSPPALMGPGQTLAEGAKQRGWPTIEALRGHFIIVVGGEGVSEYAATSPRSRLCFAFGHADDEWPIPDWKNHVFYNMHVFSKHYERWGKHVAAVADRPEKIVRGWVLNNAGIWSKALAAGLNILPTDKIKHHAWAAVGDTPFRRLAPLDT